MKEKITGIYKIISPSKKIYIGQSTDIYKRLKTYKRLNCKKQPKLYNSLLKHGPENHIFEILEECHEDYLDELESWWKHYYGTKCVEEGLCCAYIDGKGGKHSQETCLKKSKANKGRPKPKDFNKKHIETLKKPILQYSLQGEFIKEFNSIKEAELLLNLPSGGVNICLRNKSKSSYSFQWRYKTENYPLKIEPISQNGNNGKKHSKETITKRSISNKDKIKHNLKSKNIISIKISKPISQFNKQNNFIQNFTSITQASKTLNINLSDISSCCRGKLKSAGGFIWKYK